MTTYSFPAAPASLLGWRAVADHPTLFKSDRFPFLLKRVEDWPQVVACGGVYLESQGQWFYIAGSAFREWIKRPGFYSIEYGLQFKPLSADRYNVSGGGSPTHSWSARPFMINSLMAGDFAVFGVPGRTLTGIGSSMTYAHKMDTAVPLYRDQTGVIVTENVTARDTTFKDTPGSVVPARSADAWNAASANFLHGRFPSGAMVAAWPVHRTVGQILNDQRATVLQDADDGYDAMSEALDNAVKKYNAEVLHLPLVVSFDSINGPRLDVWSQAVCRTMSPAPEAGKTTYSFSGMKLYNLLYDPARIGDVYYVPSGVWDILNGTVGMTFSGATPTGQGWVTSDFTPPAICVSFGPCEGALIDSDFGQVPFGADASDVWRLFQPSFFTKKGHGHATFFGMPIKQVVRSMATRWMVEDDTLEGLTTTQPGDLLATIGVPVEGVQIGWTINRTKTGLDEASTQQYKEAAARETRAKYVPLSSYQTYGFDPIAKIQRILEEVCDEAEDIAKG